MPDTAGSRRNWAGNVTYGATSVVAPTSVPELQELVAASPRIRAIGTRHSFSTVADAPGVQVDLSSMPRTLEIDTAASTVRVDAATRWGELAPALHAAGYAVHTLGSLPHISVAGSVATGTHGSGDRARLPGERGRRARAGRCGRRAAADRARRAGLRRVRGGARRARRSSRP